MSPEEVRAAGVKASKRPPGHNPGAGGVLHQTRKLPVSMTRGGHALLRFFEGNLDLSVISDFTGKGAC
ncbi:hypothetical protein V6N11_029243 [Hibiscus sabdariffa]|uniref:Uncharacterized protein n=1 Tax=Hibiscus sabdariffa TaxID=183260 RepID=A0ABR2A834_9ROSI